MSHTRKSIGIRKIAVGFIGLLLVAYGSFYYFSKLKKTHHALKDSQLTAALDGGAGAATEEKTVERSVLLHDVVPPAGESTAPNGDKIRYNPKGEMGDPSAPVLVVEYASLTCPHCGAFVRDVMPAFVEEEVNKGRVYYIYRDFPLDPLATMATILTNCMPTRLSYFKLQEHLFTTQVQWAFVENNVEALKNEVRAAGLTEQDMNACLEDKALFNGIKFVFDAAVKTLDINGTPTFFINGVKHVGGATKEDFMKMIDEAYNRATAGKKTGGGAKPRQASRAPVRVNTAPPAIHPGESDGVVDGSDGNSNEGGDSSSDNGDGDSNVNANGADGMQGGSLSKTSDRAPLDDSDSQSSSRGDALLREGFRPERREDELDKDLERRAHIQESRFTHIASLFVYTAKFCV